MKKGQMENYREMSNFIRDSLRLKAFPVAVKYLMSSADFPEKAKQPSVALKKRITICQAVTMARSYGWSLGLTKEDLICVPAMVAFGFSDSINPADNLAGLLCDIDFAHDSETAKRELSSMSIADNSAFQAIHLTPLAKGLVDPDVIVIYGNPAQVMRMAQALVFSRGSRISGNIGGKIECTEYLLAPYLKKEPNVAIPGTGDRIFSMTQDDEMVLSFPGELLQGLYDGLKVAGRAIGARYPVTFYQNFQPKFPPQHMKLGKKLDLF
jgi:uncharacterized protein (DUF169 family)